MTEVVIVLNSEEAVKAFSRGGNVTVGGQSNTKLSVVEADRQVAFPLPLGHSELAETSLLRSPIPPLCSPIPARKVSLFNEFEARV